MVAISNITTSRDQGDLFELSQVVYHLQSDSYPLMMSVTVNASQLNSIIQVRLSISLLSRKYAEIEL